MVYHTITISRPLLFSLSYRTNATFEFEFNFNFLAKVSIYLRIPGSPTYVPYLTLLYLVHAGETKS